MRVTLVHLEGRKAFTTLAVNFTSCLKCLFEQTRALSKPQANNASKMVMCFHKLRMSLTTFQVEYKLQSKVASLQSEQDYLITYKVKAI